MPIVWVKFAQYNYFLLIIQTLGHCFSKEMLLFVLCTVSTTETIYIGCTSLEVL